VVHKFELDGQGTFVFDKATLTDDGRKGIEKVVQDLRAAGVTVTSMTIAGYTDPLGSTAYNQRLSLERANAVRDHMVSQGIPASVIRTEGRGESDPKVTQADCKAKGEAKSRNALIACLLPNRRVEIHASGERRD
jgi:OOP family OmpA-OmpF porin